MIKGTLFVVSAPSGCGKGTILKEVFKDADKIYYSVSATTRAPRDEDTDGVTYHFMTKDGFESLIRNDGFLEYAEYCGNYYGTPKAPVMEKLENGCDVVLEIETIGAFNVKEAYPEAVMIFILPPSLKELKRRLLKRGTESLKVVDKRIERARDEILLADRYDYILINDGLEKAVEDFKNICSIAKTKVNRNKIINEVLENA